MSKSLARLVRSDVARHGAIVLGGVLVANAFNYLFYMLIGRRAGVIVYGEVTSLASALLVLSAPANVGMLVVARLAADLDARGERAALRRLGDLVTAWTAGIGIVILGIIAVERDPIARFFHLTDAVSVLVSAVGLALYFIVLVQRGVLQGAHQFEDYSISLALESAARVAVGVALVGVFAASGALAGIAVSLVLAALYNAWRFRRRFGALASRVVLDRATTVKVATNIGLGQTAITVLTFYDIPLVKHAFDAHSAGLYAAAAFVGRAVIAICAFIPTIVLPKATARAAAGRSPLPLLAAAVGCAVAFVAVATLAAAVAPRFIVTLISARAFADAGPLVLTYVLASGALAVAGVISSYQFGLHRYTFVLPMCAAAAAEIVTLAVWHPSLRAVVGVLLAGHLCVLAATLIRVTAAVSPRELAEPDTVPGIA